ERQARCVHLAAAGSSTLTGSISAFAGQALQQRIRSGVLPEHERGRQGGACGLIVEGRRSRVSWPASLTDRMTIKPDATTLRLAAFPVTNLRPDVVLVLLGSGLIAGSAQISLPLPF